MANYTTNVSDKTKNKCKQLMLVGGLGLQYFYVGKIKTGLIRLVFGILFWVLFFAGISEGEVAMIAAGIGSLVAVNLFELAKLSLGKFKDNIGNYVRQ